MLRKWRFSLNKTTIGRCVELMSSIATHVCILALHRSQKMHNFFLFIVNKRSYVKMLCVQNIFIYHHNAHRSCRQHCMGCGGAWKINFPPRKRPMRWRKMNTQHWMGCGGNYVKNFGANHRPAFFLGVACYVSHIFI